MNYYEIGQRIRKARRSRGLSQEQLAEQIGISTTHMSHIETGNTKLSLPVLVDLAAKLDVRVDYLLCHDSPLERNIHTDAILQILDSCNIQQLRIIEDVLKATKSSLDQYL